MGTRDVVEARRGTQGGRGGVSWVTDLNVKTRDYPNTLFDLSGRQGLAEKVQLWTDDNATVEPMRFDTKVS